MPLAFARSSVYAPFLSLYRFELECDAYWYNNVMMSYDSSNSDCAVSPLVIQRQPTMASRRRLGEERGEKHDNGITHFRVSGWIESENCFDNFFQLFVSQSEVQGCACCCCCLCSATTRKFLLSRRFESIWARAFLSPMHYNEVANTHESARFCYLN
jgi:hypothetical protein